MSGGLAIRNLVSKQRALVFRNRKAITDSPECCGACAGLTFWRATPCTEQEGCSEAVTGEIYVSRSQRCLDGSPIGDVIGFNNRCWVVEKGGPVYELCDVWHECTPGPPDIRCCVPADATILNPDLLVYCTSACDTGECNDYIPRRYIRLIPCPGSAEGAPTYFLDSLLGFFGCGVYRVGDRCYLADCANAQDARPPEDQLNPQVEGPWPTCCVCLAAVGSCLPVTQSVGCDAPPGPECCCRTYEPGMRLDFHYESRLWEHGQYNTLLTTIIDGWCIIASDGSIESHATINVFIDYLGPCTPGAPDCPPPGDCRVYLTQNEPYTVVPVCPCPIWIPKPCEGDPGVWDGWATCDESFSSYTWTNPNPPECDGTEYGLVREERSGWFVLSGMQDALCGGGCEDAAAQKLSEIPIKPESKRNRPCRSCFQRELEEVPL